MNLICAALLFLIALVFALAGVTRAGAWLIERRNPPVGEFVDINGAQIHYVHIPAPAGAALPPIVFIHGASANLRDQMLPLRPLLEGRAEMLFLDRPGFGWSERGAGNNETLAAQADTIAALMDRLGIGKAIIAGHSFGGAVTTAFAQKHPEKTLGLVFLAPVSHPWPGGATAWYYKLTAIPIVGSLFSETLAYPAGILQIGNATSCVFSPNKVPDGYVDDTSIPLVLRPRAFRANAVDVAQLYDYVLKASPGYRDIKAPTVVISGDRDKVVYATIHSVGLGRDIPGAELIWVRNLGHKPDWIAPDLVVGAIEKVAGKDIDLQAMARTVESRIAGDTQGAGRCPELKVPDAQLAPT
ncbi:alpha/beta hydrolase [Mesorhizobium sp. M1C.F.Ca.ET.193.01.1.1]|uniref:alpha/beta fold hydrolase n=1 Tax=unclassified Mesorhizobium TaxID=325217 RepID=UPI000FD4589F|nr:MULTISPECIES: alpha/beta hydrolase [unclassified Mesorhizobium]TGT04638.1 alpha/beta hydrolase [bacterium M00.F.Ca.ET.177.01.1.1]TGQ57466.1 alpha/beta hydrolase [Mesorhizobium sp. M1C.F.Ca.ET.210.01.1.1]TGQ75924.1 alpha/beta hydrolase [Mesorhizobium sp. M1C.F.Ca.ET.212.01.1.1]TGR14307.1 alpha/beta hydrolase [Mesorhizobium sp. M1C.F.Ca.ET.204.01.1.1]TGR35469.1 alpha/beta hydrolase [Mesorhizobium sp. M1C.F.Ca.ET.196.01.1.1]